MRYMRTDAIREFFQKWPTADAAKEALLAHLDALDEEPEAYGFEHVAEADGFAAEESEREVFYVWRYPQDKLPADMTARVYITGPDDDAEYDAEVLYYEALLWDPESRRVIRYSNTHECGWTTFQTCAEAVAWLNEQLGGDIIERLP